MGNERTRRVSTNHGAYADAKVLITGGTGSIGGELVRSLLRHSPKQVIVLDNDENGLFEMRNSLVDSAKVRLKLGDVRDNHCLEAVMTDCDYVFHAAALKHVIFCEGNPYEAISTNILGTQNVIDYCVKYGVRKFVFVSTDKAVNPTSTLGATKLLAEKLVINASKHTGGPIFSIVRFGNVIGSRGSVLLIFEKQVRAGGPITVTNPAMTRFIMEPSEAAELVLRAAEEANQGEIFVLKMKAVRIDQLAEACRTYFSELFGVNANRIEIKTIGAQPGEKTHEQLMNEIEATNAIETRDFYIVNPIRRDTGRPVQTWAEKKGSSSTDVLPLAVPEIVKVISRLYEADS